ncbi:hypothetical protein [Mycoplasma seminis]|uniref:Uncharacterized protein n=1 Tax=Mycoplasma seminis TaxID=512749 RepID=A0ABY9H9P1_9MOLU|nr:hypothetical protein [Mycoplasma seminis]WLP85211.1 hypothetical protein Q8852_02725 [Mycoplasma seminis]
MKQQIDEEIKEKNYGLEKQLYQEKVNVISKYFSHLKNFSITDRKLAKLQANAVENNSKYYWYNLDEKQNHPKVYLIDFHPYVMEDTFKGNHWSVYRDDFTDYFNENSFPYKTMEKINETILNGAKNLLNEADYQAFEDMYLEENFMVQDIFKITFEEISKYQVICIDATVAELVDNVKSFMDEIEVKKYLKDFKDFSQEFNKHILKPLVEVLDEEMQFTMQKALFETGANEYLAYMQNNDALCEITNCNETLDNEYLALHDAEITLKTININVWNEEYKIQKAFNENAETNETTQQNENETEEETSGFKM